MLSRNLAFGALLALVTSLLTPWWVLRDASTGTAVAAVHPLGFPGEIANPWAMWLSAGLAIGGLALLFLRLAAGSWRHEPASWRRDLSIATMLLVASVAVAFYWPAQYTFWGRSEFLLNDTAGTTAGLVGNPGLGWWLAGISALLTGVAAWYRLPDSPAA